MKRASLSLLAGLLTVAVLECIFRVRYDDLPSLAPLKSPDAVEFWGHERPPIATSPTTSANCQDPPGETRGGSAHVAPPVRSHSWGTAGAVLPEILVAGDSIAWGYGVEPSEAWGAILGASLFQSMEQGLSVQVVGIPGGGYCEVLRGIHRELDAKSPDVIVLQLFADDLEQRAMILMDGAPVAYPSQADSPTTRALASHSYLANWAWSRWESRLRSEPTRFISAEGQQHFREAIVNLQQRTSAQGIQLVVFQLQPTGMSLCSGSPACDWYQHDHALISQLLEESEVDAIDLGNLWAGSGSWILERERQRMGTETEYVAVHPNKAGHTRLAEALLLPVEQALKQ